MADPVWRTTKQNWKPTDYFNFDDWTRIADNIRLVYAQYIKVFDDPPEYVGVRYPLAKTALINADVYNLLIDGVNVFNNPLMNLNLPKLRKFSVNDHTFTYTDLNDLEGSISKEKIALDNNIKIKPRLSFRLGNSGRSF